MGGLLGAALHELPVLEQLRPSSPVPRLSDDEVESSEPDRVEEVSLERSLARREAGVGSVEPGKKP